VTHAFCTLFDVNYLPRGLVLQRSLARHCEDFRLWVFCMDPASEKALRQLNLASTTVVPLDELEGHDAALLGTKADRTQVEYCWTATPAVCRYVLENAPEVEAITYLDADLRFFSDPQPLFDELGSRSILIVPHRYAPEYQHKEATSGTYNVEWLTFRRDADGLSALRWWHDRCIEWCYFRWEDGKLGDQKYLDDFPRLFRGVHALRHPGGGLAPWNVANHTLTDDGGRVHVDGEPLVFYHYHSLRLFRRSATARLATAAGRLRPGVGPFPLDWTTNYPVGEAELRLVWEPYLRDLGAAYRTIGSLPGVEDYPVRELVRRLAGLGRRGARRLRERVDPARWLPGWKTRYRNSWRDDDVARQMLALTETQLRAPESVLPYTAFRELVAPLLSDPRFPNPARLLDIGAGAGAYGELIERWWPGRFEYVGADYSAEILAVARERWPARTFVRKDILEPGALDGYDVVLASALLDVLPEVEPGLGALLGSDARWVALHRQRIDERRSRVEVAAGYHGQHTYRTYVTRAELESAAARYGRIISGEVLVDGDVHSFLLERS
jgi:Methyltransferase domain